MGDAGATALRPLLAAEVAALLASAVDPAEASGLCALGARGGLAALAAAVGDTDTSTHDAGGAALHGALFATAVRDAESAALGRLVALWEAAAPSVRLGARRCRANVSAGIVFTVCGAPTA
jgi:hypothetical protein